MPTLTRWFVKSSLVSLALGLSAGIWLQIPGAPAGLFPVSLHLLTYGWLTQLIFGIALWMFPFASKAHPRGPVWLGWATFAALNGGLLARVIFEPLQAASPSPAGGVMLGVSAILQWLAGIGFAANIWPRVKGK